MAKEIEVKTRAKVHPEEQAPTQGKIFERGTFWRIARRALKDERIVVPDSSSKTGKSHKSDYFIMTDLVYGQAGRTYIKAQELIEDRHREYVVVREDMDSFFNALTFNSKADLLRVLVRELRYETVTNVNSGDEIEFLYEGQWLTAKVKRVSRISILVERPNGVKYRVQHGLFRLVQDIVPPSMM